jgi:peptidoglycan/xylan/chitin deacetylase (PgdA/CDA1 family)
MATLFFLGCSYQPVSQSKKEVVITKTEFWIDRFSKPGAKPNAGGNWFTVTDNGNGGKSTIEPFQSTDTSEHCLNYNFTLSRGDFKWDPYVSVSLPIALNKLPLSVQPVAIAYDFKGTRHSVQVLSAEVTDYAYHTKSVAEAEQWTTVIIPFTDLRQPSWGKKVDFLKNAVTGFNWLVMGKDGYTGKISIDNVRLLKVLPTAPIVLKPSTQIVSFQPLNLPEKVSRQIPAEVSIANWQDFSKAAYSLTFDDGFLSHYKYVAPILNKNNLKGTFFLVSDVLQENTNAQATWKYGYWENFRQLSLQGHEIGAHTCSHPNLTKTIKGDEKTIGTVKYELFHPFEVFHKQIPSANVSTFAYPFGDFNDEIKSEVRTAYVAARGVNNGDNAVTPNDWFNIPTKSIVYNDTRTLGSDQLKFDDLKSWIEQNTIQKGGWSVYLAHEVIPFKEAIVSNDTWQPVSVESFEPFVSWLSIKQQQKELWIAPFGTVSAYVRERDNVKVTYELKDDQVLLSVTDDLPNDKFNVALSVEVLVPLKWKNISVTQNGIKIIPLSFADGKLRINLIPDAGQVIIAEQ